MNYLSISNKKYGRLHALLRARGVQLQPKMVICSECRGVLYRERNHQRSFQQFTVQDFHDKNSTKT